MSLWLKTQSLNVGLCLPIAMLLTSLARTTTLTKALLLCHSQVATQMLWLSELSTLFMINSRMRFVSRNNPQQPISFASCTVLQCNETSSNCMISHCSKHFSQQ